MRIFNQLVFDQLVRGTAEVYSSTDFNDLLGKGDEVVYEVEVEDSSGTTPTLTVKHHSSNSGKGFFALTALISAEDVSSGQLPYRKVVSQSTLLGGLGRVGVTLGGTTPTARVRIWACGRSK